MRRANPKDSLTGRMADILKENEAINDQIQILYMKTNNLTEEYETLLREKIKKECLLNHYTWVVLLNQYSQPYLQAEEHDDYQVTGLASGEGGSYHFGIDLGDSFSLRSDDGDLTIYHSDYGQIGTDFFSFIKDWGLTKIKCTGVDYEIKEAESKLLSLQKIKEIAKKYEYNP